MVTVIIPVFNRERSIKRAVESVLNQTFKDLEVIVVDDGSTDSTKEVIETIPDSRIRYVYQQNAGACAARNHGIDLAQGDYIAFHDSDDTWRAEKLEKQMKVFERTDADIVFCRLLRHLDDQRSELKPDQCQQGMVSPIVNLFGIGTQTLVAKREVFQKYRFDEEFPRFQEFELLLRATKEYKLYCVDEPLVDYYVGEDSISSNPEKLYRACELLLSKNPDLAQTYPVMAKKMAHYLLTEGNRVKKNHGQWGKYVKLANRCARDGKLMLKELLIRLGIYSLLTKK